MFIELLFIVLLGLLSAFEEIQQLVQRGDWHITMFWIPIWEIDQTSEWKDFDSHHIAFGAFVVVMFVYAYLQTIFPMSGIWYIIYFIFFWYIRNIGMHYFFRRNGYKEPKYLLPLIGKYIFK